MENPESETSKKYSKIDIKDLGLSTDQEAIEFVRKLRTIGTTAYYMTNGEEKYLIGKFGDEVPVLPLALKQKVEILEKEIESIKVSIQELKAAKALETQLPKLPEVPQVQTIPLSSKPEENVPLSVTPQLGFKSRLETQTEATVSTPEAPMRELTFSCPSCKNTFSEKVPLRGKIVKVICPKCGAIVFKSGWSRRKKLVVGVGTAVAVLFLIRLFIL
jgi:predicted RNA-binding Zn-ribbon protein involved in translation (DUF1610 family)